METVPYAHDGADASRRSLPASSSHPRRAPARLPAPVRSRHTPAQPTIPTIELQVETMSSISTRVFLYTWYAVLIIALLVESNVGLQWVSRNFCGDEVVSAYRLDDWNSSNCISWEAYWIQATAAADGGDGASVLSSPSSPSGRYAYTAWPPSDSVRDASADYTVLLQRSAWPSARQNASPVVASNSAASTNERRSPLDAAAAAANPATGSSVAGNTTTTTTTSSAPFPPTPGPTMPPLRRVYKLRWTAVSLSAVMDRELNRFLHVFISLASPLAAAQRSCLSSEHEAAGADPPSGSPCEALNSLPPSPPLKTYEVLVALEETTTAPASSSESDSSTASSQSSASPSLSSSSSSGSSPSKRNNTQYVYTYRTSVTCWRSTQRCSNLVLPANVVIPANRSQLTVTLIDVDAELAKATLQATRQCHDSRAPSSSVKRQQRPPASTAGTSSRLQRLAQATFSALLATLTTAAASSTGVGVMYQRANYTLGTIIARYVLLVITLVGMLRFLYRVRQGPRMLYEQKWTLALQIGLLCYLNPLYWWCVHATRYRRDGGNSSTAGGTATTTESLRGWSRVAAQVQRVGLYYVEFHVPTYFVALTVCYVWSMIAGSFRWSAIAAPSSATPTIASSPAPVVNVAGASSNTEADLSAAAASSGGAESPTVVAIGQRALTVLSSQPARQRVRALLVVFLLLVAALDCAKCALEEAGPGGAEVTCRGARCLQVQRAILYVLVLGILSSGVGLYWLRRNLARHPYLSTRPQQLACRIMIFMYFTGGVYCAVQVLLLETLYAQVITIIYYQPLVQLSHLLVLTSFVLHMTYVYTTTQSSLQIPLRPSDPRWKTVGWSSRWYRWLDWHGGSLYVFFNEAEERRFYEVQVAYQLAKRERKERRRQPKKQKERSRQLPPLSPQSGAARPAGSSSFGGGRHTCPESHAAHRGHRDAQEAAVDAAVAGRGTDSTAASCFPQSHSSGLLLSPMPTALSVQTLSAFSERDENDWLLQPEGGGMYSRHRTASTITQPSATTSEDTTHGRGVEDEEGEEDDDATSTLRAAREGRGSRCSNSDKLNPPAVTSLPAILAPSRGQESGNAVHDVANASLTDGNASRRTLARASSRVLTALHSAESRLVDGTATFIDLLADTCVDRPLQVLLRQRARQRLVFFNLETAIDCLNLSREAYAVQVSRGDDLIRTGIQVDAGEVPRVALSFAERVIARLLSLCLKGSPLEEPETAEAVAGAVDALESRRAEGDEEEEAVDEDAEDAEESGVRRPLLSKPLALAPSTPTISSQGSPAAASAGGAQGCVHASEHATSKSWRRLFGLAETPPPVVPSTAGEEGVPVHARTPSSPGLQHGPAAAVGAPPSPTSAAAGPRTEVILVPHMDVEQFGYTPIAILETRGVQVVVARMDVSGACPVHVGKHPRLTIAFRGTDNVANALEDIRFRQRTWKEMETPTLRPRATVHSGFLELWMSLKEQVMDVVLKELRVQCEAPGNSARATDDQQQEDADGPAAATPTAAETGVFRSAVPFSTEWTLPSSRQHQHSEDTHGHHHREGFLRIYVTGHSLGGALASLCAYSLRRMLLLIRYPEPDLVVYTFGQPRIGNSVFKQHYNEAVPCTFRVVNESDVVSGFNILGGHHVGVQVNVDRHGNYICKPMYIERMLRPTRGRGLALLNHTLAAYANSLNAVADTYAHGACPVRCQVSYVDQVESVASSESDDGTCTATMSDSTRPQREELREPNGAV